MLSLSQRLPEDALATLLSAGTRLRFKAGQTVCHQGDRVTSLHIVVSGRASSSLVSRTGETVSLGVLGRGEIFGETALLDVAAVHPASVVASEPLELLAVEPSGFRSLQLQQPEVAGALLSVMASRVHALTESLVDAFHVPADVRVLKRLAALVQTYGSGGANTVIPVDQAQLAAMAGVSRATANRTLRREEVAGVLRLGRGKITVLDAQRLAASGDYSPVAPPPRPAGVVSTVDGERRLVAVVCVELVRDDANSPDPEDSQVDQAFRTSRVRGVMEGCGGRLEQLVGNHLIGLFGVPALGDDVRNALRAAEAIVSDGQIGGDRVRVGVEAGIALVGQRGDGGATPAGDVVDVAQALASKAAPGSVALGPEIKRTHPARANITGPMLGREQEFGLLRNVWRRVVSERRPWLVTLLGPPGIGKTRLGNELLALVESEGAAVLRGRSRAYAERTGYSAFADQVRAAAGIGDTDSPAEAHTKLTSCVAELLHGAVAETVTRDLGLILGSRQSTAADRQAMFTSARRFVAALGRRRPTILVFEDIHWSEATQLDLVLWLATRLTDTAVLILCISRDGLLDSRPDWAGGLSNASSLQLDVLPLDVAYRFATHLLGGGRRGESIRRRLVEISGGNPLFIEELVAATRDRPEQRDRLPTTLVTAINARLDALSSPVRDVLLDAAVIGKTFWRGAVSHTRTHPDLDEHLEELARKGLIREEPASRLPNDPEFEFKHGLIRQVAYDTIPRSRRRVAHARVAQWLEKTVGHRSGEPVSLLAHHWLEAGEPERALRYLVSAADQAGRAAAHREAAASLSEALRVVDSSRDSSLIADLRGRRGTQLARFGDWAGARPDLEYAVAHLPTSDVDKRVRYLDELAMVCHWLIDEKGVRDYATEAFNIAKAAGRQALMAGAAGMIGLADSSEGDLDSSLKRFERVLEHPTGIPSELLAPTAELLALSLYWRGRAHDAVGRAEQALDIARASTNTNTTIRALGNLVIALASAGRYDEAAQTFARAREFGEEFGTTPFLARAIAMYGGVRLELEDFEAAEALAREAAQLAQHHQFPPAIVSTGIDLMFNYARRGEPELGERLIPQVEGSVHSALGAHGWLWRLRFASARAEICVARARWGDARPLAEDALVRARATHRPKYEILAEGLLARVAAAEGKSKDAAALSHAAVERARSLGDPAVLRRAMQVQQELR